MKIQNILVLSAAAAVAVNLRSLRHNAFRKHHGVAPKTPKPTPDAKKQFDQLTWMLQKHKSMQRSLGKQHKMSVYNHYFKEYVSSMRYRFTK